MASYELLDAVNTKGVQTTADVAKVLDISERDAGRQLREAQREGLVDTEIDMSRNVPPDFERRFWHLTEDGWAEWDRLDKERSAS